jgi:hypothetical protein
MKKLAALSLTLGIMFGLCLILSLILENTSKAMSWAVSGTWTEAVLEAKNSIAGKAAVKGIPVDSLDTGSEMQLLLKRFPAEMSVVRPYIANNAKDLLRTMDGMAEEMIIRGIIGDFKDTGWFDLKISELRSLDDGASRIAGLLDLILIANEIKGIHEHLEWLEVAAVEAAIDDMKSDRSYNPDRSHQQFDELKLLAERGFNGIYKNDPVITRSRKKSICNLKGIFCFPTRFSASTASLSAVMLSVPIPGSQIPPPWEHSPITGLTSPQPAAADSMRKSANYQTWEVK